MSGHLRTPFHGKQADGGAVFGTQDGWEMPLHFGSWQDEVGQARTRAIVCDLSHTGRIRVRGDGSLDLLDRACAADVVHQEDDTARGGLLCDDRGGIIDAVRLLRLEDSWIVLTSPAAREAVLEHLSGLADEMGAKVDDQTPKTAMVAVAGPAAASLLDAALPIKVSDMPDDAVKVGSLLIAKYVALRSTRWGLWTLEVILPTMMAGQAWRYITQRAGANCVRPAGEIAQDVLRVESGGLRYGHEINRTVDPFLAGLEGRIDWGHGFVGKAALEALRGRAPQRRLVGLRVTPPRSAGPASASAEIPRLGWSVFRLEGGQAGNVTSGTFSPTLNAVIALAYLAADLSQPGTPLRIGPEGQSAMDAVVCDLPMVPG